MSTAYNTNQSPTYFLRTLATYLHQPIVLFYLNN